MRDGDDEEVVTLMLSRQLSTGSIHAIHTTDDGMYVAHTSGGYGCGYGTKAL